MAKKSKEPKPTGLDVEVVSRKKQDQNIERLLKRFQGMIDDESQRPVILSVVRGYMSS